MRVKASVVAMGIVSIFTAVSNVALATDWCGSNEWGYMVACNSPTAWEDYRRDRELETNNPAPDGEWYFPANNDLNPVAATCASSAETRQAHALHDILAWRTRAGADWQVDEGYDVVMVEFDDGAMELYHWNYDFWHSAPETSPPHDWRLQSGFTFAAPFPGNLACFGSFWNNYYRSKPFPPTHRD